MIYLDHTATKFISPKVLAYYNELLLFENFNPAARYQAGLDTKKKIAACKKQFVSLLGLADYECIVTSGASESINLALRGLAEAYPQRAKRIVSTELEHSATRQNLLKLEREGYEIIRLKAINGIIDLADLREALSEPVLCLSLIVVQNEIGSVLNTEEIIREARAHQKQIKIHLDGVQAVGKLDSAFANLDADLISLSAHKFGAPKGIGYLLKKGDCKLEPQIVGGGQQDNLRSGTENYPLLAASKLALESSLEHFSENYSLVESLRAYFLDALSSSKIEFFVLEGKEQVPHILALNLPALRAETIMNALSAEGVYLSIGSACSSNKGGNFALYENFGLNSVEAKHVVRISLAETNTCEELNTLCQLLKKIIDKYGY